MGCYTKIRLTCGKCGLRINVQSKADPDDNGTYSGECAPFIVGVALLGEVVGCPECGCMNKVVESHTRNILPIKLQSTP